MEQVIRAAVCAAAQLGSVGHAQGALLRNEKEKYWRMANGYCLQDAPKGIAAVSGLIAANAELAAKVRGALRVGVHWDTEVKSGAHRVCQVFCSAMPVSYEKKARATDWAAFASELLISAYLSTLAVGAILARERRSRVTVFLTAVGGGAFGNRMGAHMSRGSDLPSCLREALIWPGEVVTTKVLIVYTKSAQHALV